MYPNQKLLHALIRDYIEQKQPTHQEEKLFYEALAFIDSKFAGYFSSSIGDNQAKKTLYQILDAALSQDSEGFHFNPWTVLKLKQELRTKLNYQINEVDGNIQYLGLQEKYLGKVLGAQERLTQLDMERILISWGLQAQVGVGHFKVEDIAMFLNEGREKHSQSQEPYYIPLLLDKGNSHWLEVVVYVDPIQKTIHYSLKDSARLSEAQKKELDKTMQEAIPFHTTFAAGKQIETYEAYPEKHWKIKGTINSNKNSDGTYTEGYRALHSLLNEPTLSGHLVWNDLAQTYANCTGNSSSLVKEVYRQQLNVMILPIKLAHKLQREDLISIDGSKAPLQQEHLEEFLQNMDLEPNLGKKGISTNPFVQKKVDEYNAFLKVVRFPGAELGSLNSQDYEDYLQKLAVRLKDNKKNLENLIIAPSTLTALDGLNAFISKTTNLRFDELTLNLKQTLGNDKEKFLLKFKTLLLNISEKNLKTLRIIDKNQTIDETEWQELANFIKERKITIELLLPEQLQDKSIQREIDRAISRNKHDKISTYQAKILPEDQEAPPQVSERPIRTRPRGKHDLRVETNFQEQKQQQAQITQSLERYQVTEKTNTGKDELDVYAADHFRRFEGYLIEPQSGIAADKRVLSRLEAKKIWNALFGHISFVQQEERGMNTRVEINQLQTQPERYNESGDENIFNFYLAGITHQAVKKVIRHAKKLQGGLDLNHLPTGFCRIEYPKGSGKLVLHYDKELVLSQGPQDPLAIQLTEPTKTKPLSFPLVEKTIAILADGSPSERLIHDQWQLLQTEPYDREAVELFNQHLPKLLHLNEAQLQALFTLVFDGTKLNKHQFNFIMKTLADFARLYKGGYRDDLIYVPEDRFKDEFNSIEDYQTFITDLACTYKAPLGWSQNHLLFKLLTKNKGLSNKIEQICQDLEFSDYNLDALLQVYNQQGETGLQNLLTDWQKRDPAILKSLQHSLLCHAESYLPLLDPEYQNALGIIENFSGAQKEWWDRLLELHGQNVGFDDLPALLAAFLKFSQEIKERNLTFYKLPEGNFPDVKSLPTALTRMLTILDHCFEKDLQEQWSQMSLLSLHANGALRALTDAKMEEGYCCFIIPKMRATALGYSQQSGYKCGTENNWKDIGKDSLFITKEEKKNLSIQGIEENFYRCIAHQKKHLPLSFYQQAFEALKARKFKLIVASELAAILVGATTGGQYDFLSGDEAEALQQWQVILDCYSEITLPTFLTIIPMIKEKFRAHCADSTFRLRKVPPLPLLAQFTHLQFNVLNTKRSFVTQPKETWELLDEQFKALNKITDGFTNYTRAYGNSVYEGLRFYEVTEIEKSTGSFLGAYLDVVEEISRPASYFLARAKKEVGIKKALIRLISTFQINENAAKNLTLQINSIKEPKEVKKILQGLELLSAMENNLKANKEKLTAKDLAQFIEDIVSNVRKKNNFFHIKQDIKSIEKTVQDHFGNCFKPGFFDNLTMSAEKIPPVVQAFIEAHFKGSDQDEIKKILLRFNLEGDNRYYSDIVHQIFPLVEKLSQQDRGNFYACLQRDELFKAPKPSIEEFMALLEALLNRGQVHDFIYFLDQDDSQKADGLLKKATLYLTRILPEVGKIKSRVVTKQDSLDLVCQLLLTSPAESLDKTPRINRKQEKDFQALEQLIVDLQEIKDGELELNVGNLQALQIKIMFFMEMVPQAAEFTAVKNLAAQIKIALAPQKSAKQTVNPLRRLATKLRWGPQKEETKASNAVEETTRVLPAKELFSSALAQLEEAYNKRIDFCGVFNDFIKMTYQLAEQYPGSKGLLIDFIRSYLTALAAENPLAPPDPKNKGKAKVGVAPKRSTAFIVNAWDNINHLKTVFTEIQDADIVRSLCYHYSGKEGDFTPQALITLLNQQEFIKLRPEHKKLILNLITVLLNNEKVFTSEELKSILQLCNNDEHGEEFLSQLTEFYQFAPYPTLEQLVAWDNVERSTVSYVDELKNQYRSFNQKPCEREPENGFDLDLAKRKRSGFEGCKISDEELEQLKNETGLVQGIETKDLVDEFTQFKTLGQDIDYARLVAITAELLYRSKGQDGGAGRSFELNTTQYLAIYAMLKQGSHVTGEIGTGEGKSRILAVCNACKYGLGKTVDFVTSDVQLAQRDYLEFQSYFRMLGAKTNIIYADTPPDQYRLDGINYSDATSLRLFRNAASSQGKGDLVLNPDASKRALCLDEADKVYFDMADTRFNYSMEGDKSIKGMEWIYPLLIEFFEDVDHEKLYYKNIDACNEAFIKFASSQKSPKEVERLKAVSQLQLETWQKAAITAKSLTFEIDFVLEPQASLLTASGLVKTSAARIITGDRVSQSSQFSFGVHQCLHARLNWLKTHPQPAKTIADRRFQVKLAKCKHSFIIEAEKQIIYSSTSKSLLDDYKASDLLAVTGSAGSMIEREEAAKLYQHANRSQMTFIHAPRHRGLKREDRPVRLTNNADAQIMALVEYILEARRNDQPALIICENDQESSRIMKALKKNLSKANSQGGIQRIHSKMPTAEETTAIDQAGLAGMVTVSTGMIGRGTDIKLVDDAKRWGLKVLLTYLPNERDLWQIISRSGRFGAKGDARIVLDKQELKERLGKTSLKDGFYTATETYLRQQQALMSRQKQIERLIKYKVSDFNHHLTDHYFNQCLANTKESQRRDLWPAWMKFSADSDRIWNELWLEIQKELDPINPKTKEINEKLDLFREQIQHLWTELYQTVSDLKLQNQTAGGANPLSYLPDVVGELQIDANNEFFQPFDVKTVVPHQITVHEKYDPAHDGFSVIYNRRFEKLRASLRGERPWFADTRAWLKGHGILFPEFRAWLAGHISFKQFLFGYASVAKAEKIVESDLATVMTGEASYRVMADRDLLSKSTNSTEPVVQQSEQQTKLPTTEADDPPEKPQHSGGLLP